MPVFDVYDQEKACKSHVFYGGTIEAFTIRITDRLPVLLAFRTKLNDVEKSSETQRVRQQRPKTLKTGLSRCRAADDRVEGIRLGPRNQAKNPPRTNDVRGGRMRQQSIGGAPLAFRYEEMVYLTVGPVFV